MKWFSYFFMLFLKWFVVFGFFFFFDIDLGHIICQFLTEFYIIHVHVHTPLNSAINIFTCKIPSYNIVIKYIIWIKSAVLICYSVQKFKFISDWQTHGPDFFIVSQCLHGAGSSLLRYQERLFLSKYSKELVYLCWRFVK